MLSHVISLHNRRGEPGYYHEKQKFTHEFTEATKMTEEHAKNVFKLLRVKRGLPKLLTIKEAILAEHQRAVKYEQQLAKTA